MLSSSALPARHLRKTLCPIIADAVRESRADRYRKRFSASSHVWMLLLHAMSANQTLRQSHASQQADPRVRRFLGIAGEGWVSYSQLARSALRARGDGARTRLVRGYVGDHTRGPA